MKLKHTNLKLIMRFTISFIMHQIFLFLSVSIPAIFYIEVLNESENPTIINISIWLVIIVYILYCLFYGYYIAKPMYEILTKIKTLSVGNYNISTKKSRFSFLSSRLFREVYLNIETLSKILKENKKKRQEFQELRQEWASGVTHDLKTPLSYISGYTDMLLSEEYIWSLEERKEFLHEIKSKSIHMEELINDLGIAFRMDQSIGIKFKSQKIEMVELVRRVVVDIANTPFETNNEFAIIGGENLIYVEGDSKLLRRAFSNLLTNAVVHNPSNTIVKIIISKNDYLEVKIKDNGKGMDENSINHLFDRYYRGTSTDMTSGGTGLGMAIVKQIITAHNGEINVESRVGHGTCVAIKLPLI